PEGKPEEKQAFEQALFARTADQGRKTDRDSFLRELLPFVENNPRVFRVLERPDWERLIDPDWIPEEVRAILRNETALHTLSASTYLGKVRDTDAHKQSGLQLVKGLWIGFIIVISTICGAFFVS